MVELLNERTKGFGTKLGELIILPIYSTLPSHEQASPPLYSGNSAYRQLGVTHVYFSELPVSGVTHNLRPPPPPSRRARPHPRAHSANPAVPILR